MATRCKAEWREITIPGNRQAFVAVVQGKEIGTIARYNSKSAWTVHAGIGERSVRIGSCYHKEGARFMLLTAPESFWRPV